MLEIPIKAKRYIKNFLKNKDYVYVTTITNEYVDMAYNWFLSLKKINQSHLSLIVCADKQTFLKLKNYNSNINCIYLNFKLAPDFYFLEWKDVEKKIKFIVPYYICSFCKKSIFHSDVDIFFNKNPYEDIKKYLKDDDYDLILMSDRRFDYFIPERNNIDIKTISINKKNIDVGQKAAHVLYGEHNAAFCYVNINDKTYNKLKDCYSCFFDKNFMDKFEKKAEQGSAQTISNQLYKKFNLKIKLLSCFEYVNGSLWKVPYLKNKIKDNFVIVHYNYEDFSNISATELKHKKIESMKMDNHWLLQ